MSYFHHTSLNATRAILSKTVDHNRVRLLAIPEYWETDLNGDGSNLIEVSEKRRFFQHLRALDAFRILIPKDELFQFDLTKLNDSKMKSFFETGKRESRYYERLKHLARHNYTHHICFTEAPSIGHVMKFGPFILEFQESEFSELSSFKKVEYLSFKEVLESVYKQHFQLHQGTAFWRIQNSRYAWEAEWRIAASDPANGIVLSPSHIYLPRPDWTSSYREDPTAWARALSLPVGPFNYVFHDHF